MKQLVTLTIVICFGVQFSYSQGDCGCDHFVPVEAYGFNASEVSPGEVICLEAGFRPGFKLRNAVGTSSEPILIKNCGGDVLIGDALTSYGFSVAHSKHFHLTGTGEGVDDHGIIIVESVNAGLTINQGSTDFEVDHIELSNIEENPAVRIGDDPNCTFSVNEDFFTMEDCSLHHLIVNDCGTGIQIGHPLFRIGVEDPHCGTIYPHAINNVYIGDCEINNITADHAIQCYGTTGGLIENNIIRDAYNNGLKFGTDCEISVESNEINGTGSYGVYTKGCGIYNFSNNLLLNNGWIGTGAINIDFDLPIGYSSVRQLNFRHNTVVNSGGFSFKVDEAFLANAPSFVENNIFCEPNPSMTSPYEGAPYVYMTEAAEFEFNNNIYSESRADEGFLGADDDDFHLTHSANAINAGVITELEWDMEDGARNLAGAPDIGAFEYVPEPIAYFENIDLVGLYVDDFKNILGDEEAETELLEFAKNEGFNYLLLYNLSYIHSNYYDLTDPAEAIVLADFIERAKRDYGIAQMGAVGEKDASFDKIETFNSLFGDSWFQKFDVLNLEFEFWANEESDVFEYYCDSYLSPSGFPCTNEGAFDFYIEQLAAIDERAHGMGIISEIYLGKISEPEGIALGETCDRIMLHYYRTSDVYGDGTSIYNYNSDRIKSIALSDRKPAIMPIFSNREYHMGPWLLSNDMDQVMETWLHGIDAYDADFAVGVQDLNIAGHQWYRYTSFPEVEYEVYSPLEEDEYQDTEGSEISTYTDVQSETLVIIDNSSEFEELVFVQLYAMNGELILSQNLQNGANYIDLAGYTPGMYVYSLIAGDRIIETNKIIHQ